LAVLIFLLTYVSDILFSLLQIKPIYLPTVLTGMRISLI
jgi:hypothetical protein